MGRSQTMVQLTDELVEELDIEAERRGISRSELIREALDRHLADLRSTAVGSRRVAGSLAHPAYTPDTPDTPDTWGDLGRAVAC